MNALSFLVSFVPRKGDDEPLLIVGTNSKNESIKIINAIEGNEAEELYKKLTINKEDKNYD